jgi:hypothetical protein
MAVAYDGALLRTSVALGMSRMVKSLLPSTPDTRSVVLPAMVASVTLASPDAEE